VEREPFTEFPDTMEMLLNLNKFSGYKQLKADLPCTILYCKSLWQHSLPPAKLFLHQGLTVTLLEIKFKTQRPGEINILIHTRSYMPSKLQNKCFSFQDNYLDSLFCSSIEKDNNTCFHNQNYSKVHCLNSEIPFILENIPYIF